MSDYLSFVGSDRSKKVRKDLVDIIIPNAAGPEILNRLIQSMHRRLSYTIVNKAGSHISGVRIIVVSQGEFGSSSLLQKLSKDYPDTFFPVYKDVNIPPPIPYNDGLEYSARVMNPLSEYIMFLDDDMILLSDGMIESLKKFLVDGNFGNVATEHCYFGDKKKISSDGEVPDFGMGSFFFKRKLFEEIGYLDERFTFHCSDTDFNRRVRLHGHRIGILPDSNRFMIHESQRGTHNVFKGKHQHIINNDWKIFRDKWDIPSESKVGDVYQSEENLVADVDVNNQKHFDIKKQNPLGRKRYLF